MQKSSLRGRGIGTGVRRAAASAAVCLIEGLEPRVCLSSAIAAFAPQQTFAAGGGPQALAVGDVNRDGKPDVVVANYAGADIGVLLGNGNGTYLTQHTFGAGPQAYSVALADVNGDGKLDAVVANFAGGNVSVLLGNGDGTFQAQQTFATGNGPHSIAIADVNGDGKLDIAVANQTSPTSSAGILLGNGDGTFKAQQTYQTATGTFAIAVADVNSDGKPDLLVINRSNLGNSVGVLVGNGDGTFHSQTPYQLGTSSPDAIAAADVNGDGKADVILANYNSGTVGVLLNNGNGTFQSPIPYTAGLEPEYVTVGDVNGDGKADIITANYSGNTASVLLGNGDGTFQPQATFATGSRPTSVVLSDVNGDGRADLLVSNINSNSVSVLLGDVPPTVLSINRSNPVGPSATGPTVSYTVTFNEAVTGVDASDFSLALSGVTTSTPVVVSSVNSSVYTVTVNGIAGAGTLGLNLADNGTIKDAAGNPLQSGGIAAFGAQQTFGLGTVPGPASVVVGDVNNDGKPDLVEANEGDNTVGVLLGNGNGTFQPQLTFGTGSFPSSVVIADVNHDGRLDLVVDDSHDDALSVLLGNGDGTFQARMTFATSAFPTVVAVADVNKDGKLDLVATCGAVAGSVSVLLGNGDGTFSAQQVFTAGNGPSALTIADINGDGKQDLVVLNTIDSNVGVLLGNGDGTFQAMQTFATGYDATSIAVSDVNGDGKLDIVAANRGTNSYPGSTVSVLLGNGDGTFNAQQTFATGVDPIAVTIADINGDGKPDLAVTNLADYTASVLLGNGDGTFQAQQTFATGALPQSIAAADLNGDGRVDLVVANGLSNTLGVFSANSNGNFTGQTYTIAAATQDTINGTANVDQITLVQDADGTHIDWSLNGTSNGQLPINDPNGLTINGAGSNDVITLDYTHGNPLPNKLNLNGIFTVNNLATTGNPLAGTTLDIKTSTVFIAYSGPTADPLSLIQGYLKNGFNSGAWTGTATSITGSIRSSSAAANAIEYSVGYADSADSFNPANLPTNTIELRYTVQGDTNLDGTVGPADLAAVIQNYGTGTKWDQGVVTYGTTTGPADLAALIQHYTHTAPSPAQVPIGTPAVTPAVTTLPTSVQSSTNGASAALSAASATDDLKPKKVSKSKSKGHR